MFFRAPAWARSLCRVRSSRPVSLLPSQPCTLPAFLFMSLPPTACDCGKRRAVCTLSPAGNPAPIRPKCGWQGEARSGRISCPSLPPGTYNKKDDAFRSSKVSKCIN